MDNWTRAASIATVVASAAIVLTAPIYYRQLTAMSKARQLDSILAILNYTDNLALRRARYIVYEHADTLWSLLPDQADFAGRNAVDARVRELSTNLVGLHEIDLWLNALNNACFLVRYGHAPQEVVTGLLQNSLLHSWRALEPYIRWRRTWRRDIGAPSIYAQHFEWVVKESTRSHGAQGPAAVETSRVAPPQVTVRTEASDPTDSTSPMT